jgi:hypothetical protein
MSGSGTLKDTQDCTTHPCATPSLWLSLQVDYAKTPEQLGRLLDDVHEAGTKRTLLVMGCPGTTSRWE